MNGMNKLALALILGTTSSFGPNVPAQSFLEQLERTIRENAKQPPLPTKEQSKSVEELPAPTKQVKPKSPPSSISAGQIPAGSIVVPPPSILESPSSAPAASVEPGYLGIEAESISGGGIGAKVVSITENSPAWKAGLRVGDIVQGINGHAIADLDSMIDQLGQRSAGEAVKFLVSRGGKNVELTAILQSTQLASRINGPLGIGPAQPTVTDFSAGGPGWLGLVVVDLSMPFRQQFGTSPYRGAAVTNVIPGSPADLALIKPGDVVVQIDGQAVDSARVLSNWVTQSRPGQPTELLIYRGNTPRRIQLVVGIDPNSNTVRSSGFGPDSAVQNDLQSQVNELRDELRRTREQLNRLEKRLGELLDRQ